MDQKPTRTLPPEAYSVLTTVTQRYEFIAGHRLPNVPPGHRCARHHGHNYELEVSIFGPVKPHEGWVVDFYDLDQVVCPLLKVLDHVDLNDVPGLENPTAENIAWWFLQHLQRSVLVDHCKISKVRVYETKDCWADVEPVTK